MPDGQRRKKQGRDRCWMPQKVAGNVRGAPPPLPDAVTEVELDFDLRGVQEVRREQGDAVVEGRMGRSSAERAKRIEDRD